MAKDINDKKTIALIPEPKKRGRPVTGSALTPAERKARQRLHASRLVMAAVGDDKKFSQVSLTALISELERAIRNGSPATVKSISGELVKRAQANKSLQSH